ncbi:nicotinate-nucleotide--dimethylbenzimidazole phosphoribosyltransferase [Alkaliphilus serpentinus]|uniref:Nicotinate-nucleotide--dimethylbenzimidazole phosphoribosyltransferase n=1 Tax=Alkaliphilus serpentinus TaxID=1482731 RepID=A0A833HR42_9FIRM|nr:nicotinate-nucleotide--dimethylbenzimidazole phosphoribosyltransferase [Alkaliphilus serpentinus]KAB3532850.1 nicotinate-nucleotide--dimethylbenzimidazole phosphoribosyltransferase [Alkaliphilus serpentinus]
MSILNKVLGGIKPLDNEAQVKTAERLDSLIKPIGSLGKLESLAIQIAGITGEVLNKTDKKCMVVMAADNGVVEEGVSSAPQDITAIQTINMMNGLTAISVLSKQAKSDLKVVDIGICHDISHEKLISRKIRMGTGNIAKGPAMDRAEAIQGIEVGIDIVQDLHKEGYNLIGTGEMGIGNTSTSSAILIALTGATLEAAVGMGAGLSPEAFEKKKEVIGRAIEINKPDKADPIDVLAKVGGLDIAGLVGCFLGASYYRIPIVIDGVISAVAALLAYKLNPLTREYMIPSHSSLEPSYRLIMKEMNLEPNLYLNMRLGEGTGCPLMFQIIDASMAILKDMATFQEMSMNNDFLIDIR